MKFLIIGDLHLNCTHPDSPRADQARNTAKWVVEQIEAHRPDVFVHMGDLGERTWGIDHHSLTVMTKLIAEVGRLMPAKRAFWLVGNHDYHTKTGDINLMSALAPLMPGQVVAWPSAAGPEDTVFVSYLPPDKFRAERDVLIPAGEKRVLFCHQPIQGALFRHDFREQKGLDPNTLPRHTFVGHYHIPSPPDWTPLSRRNVVWYVGSPRASSFHDNAYGLTRRQQLRGAWLAEIGEGRVQSEPQFIENPHTPYYLSLSIDDESWEKVFGWFERDCGLPLDRTDVRLTVPQDRRAEAEQRLRSRGVARLTIHHRRKPRSSVVHIPSEMSPPQAVERYVGLCKDDALEGLDREELIRAGHALLNDTFPLPAGTKE